MRIVVTGVASGIGARTAELAAAAGAEVIGVDVVEPASTAVRFVRGDLSSGAGVERVVGALPDQIDALCNIAGISGKSGAVPTLAVNFFGARALAEALAGKMREGAAIVNAASGAGFRWRENIERAQALIALPGFPDVAAVVAHHRIGDIEAYGISKELLIVWTMHASRQPLFRDRRIRINAVSPGPVATPILPEFHAVLGTERIEAAVRQAGRMGVTDDIAPVIHFLCTDASRWVNGVNIPVDGGLDAARTSDALGF